MIRKYSDKVSSAVKFIVSRKKEHIIGARIPSWCMGWVYGYFIYKPKNNDCLAKSKKWKWLEKEVGEVQVSGKRWTGKSQPKEKAIPIASLFAQMVHFCFFPLSLITCFPYFVTFFCAFNTIDPKCSCILFDYHMHSTLLFCTT